MAFLPKKGAVVADTTYINNVLAAKDVSFTLPAITFLLTEIEAMGTASIPDPGRFEDMESTITKVGVDLGYSSMIEPGPKTIEHRWIQTSIDENGNTTEELCKAFLRGSPKAIPEMSVELGSPLEVPVSFAISRYQLFVGGREVYLLDRMKGQFRVNGKDFTGLRSQL